MQTFAIKQALDQAKRNGAKLEECFWLARREFVESWKNGQSHKEADLPGETATMGGLPVQFCEFLTCQAILLTQDGLVFLKLGDA